MQSPDGIFREKDGVAVKQKGPDSGDRSVSLARSMPGVAGQSQASLGALSSLKTLLSHLLQSQTPSSDSPRAIQVDRQFLLGPSSLCHALLSTIVTSSFAGKV